MTRMTLEWARMRVASRTVNSSRSFSVLLVVSVLLAASCGQSRETSAESLVDVPVDTQVIDDGLVEAPPSTPPPGVIEVTERDASVPLATIVFPDGTTAEVPGESYSAIIDSLTSSDRFTTSVYGGSFGKADEGFIAGQMVLSELFNYAMGELGVETNQEEFYTALDRLNENLVQAMANEADPETAGAEVSAEVEPYLNTLAELIARQEAISVGLSNDDEGVEVESYCARHILVDSNESALDLIDQIEAGADFGETAIEFSTDTGSGAQGGDLLCNQATAFVAPFSEAMVSAEVDSVVGPVETEFGFHIIQVYEVKTETVLPDTGELFSILMDEIVLGSTVEVDPIVGTWDPDTLSIISAD